MEDQIVRADKRLRNQVLSGLAVFVVLGLLGIQWISSFLENIRQLIGTDPELAHRKLVSFLNTVAMVHALVSIGFATYVLSLGVKTLRAGRYPPAGMRVIKVTKVQVGGKAKAIAFTHIFVALLLLSTNAIVWHLRNIVEKLAQG